MNELELIETTCELLRGEYKGGVIIHNGEKDVFWQTYGNEQQIIEAITNAMIYEPLLYHLVIQAVEATEEYNAKTN